MAWNDQVSGVFLPLILALLGVVFLWQSAVHRKVERVDGTRRIRNGAGIFGAGLLVLGAALLVRTLSGNHEPLPSTTSNIQTQAQPNGHSTEPVSVLSPASPVPTPVSSWMAEKALESEIKNQKAKGLFPSQLEGRGPSGKVEFRATFSPIPTGGFDFVYFLGHSEATFQTASTRIREGGFRLLDNQSFTSQTGEIKYQSVWVKP